MRRLFAALFLLSAVPASAKGLLVSPSHLSVTAVHGASADETLVLTPATAETTHVAVSVETFGLDADGRPWRGPGSETPRSLTSLLDVDASSLVLEDGKPVSLRVKLTPPESTGSYWAALVLEVEPVETAGSPDVPIHVVTRLVVPVFVTVLGGAAPRLALEGLVARSMADGSVEITGTVENTGSEVVRTPVFLTLEEPSPGGAIEVATREIPSLTFFPGFPRRIRAVVSAPLSARGSLVAGVLIPYGEFLAESRVPVAP
jgi:hypothetical protein